MSRPARPEVESVLQFVRDSLNAAHLLHELEQTEENPDCWIVVARDDDGYENRGLVGWDDETNAVIYFAYDPLRFNHDQAEGIPEMESACWWQPDTAIMLLMHLKGDARRIMAKERARKQSEKNT